MSNVRISKGILIDCDIPTKQFIISLNSRQAEPFILNDLDETSLFVDAKAIPLIQKSLEELWEKNVYVRQSP